MIKKVSSYCLLDLPSEIRTFDLNGSIIRNKTTITKP